MNKKGKEKREEIYKVIVIGDPSVGNSELLVKFATSQIEGKFFSIVGGSIFKTAIDLKEYSITADLEFWYTEIGQPPFHIDLRPYFSGADGALLVFDLTRSSTFSGINYWYSEIVEFGLSKIPKIIIGNKAHLGDERKIILPMATHLCEKLNTHYYETSSLTGYNVKEVFEKITELIYKARNLDELEKNETLIIKPYGGILIPSPTIPKRNTDSLVDPMWIRHLDHLSTFHPRFYRNIRQTDISQKEKKEIHKEKKRE